MTAFSTTVAVTTAVDGSFTRELVLTGLIHTVAVLVGGLVTPDITITDARTGDVILDVTGVLDDKRYQPRVPMQGSDGDDLFPTVYDAPAVTGRMLITVAGGGDRKIGAILLFGER